MKVARLAYPLDNDILGVHESSNLASMHLSIEFNPKPEEFIPVVNREVLEDQKLAKIG